MARPKGSKNRTSVVDVLTREMASLTSKAERLEKDLEETNASIVRCQTALDAYAVVETEEKQAAE